MFTCREGLFLGHQDEVTFVLFLVVAGEAVLFQDRLNVLLEINAWFLLQFETCWPFGTRCDPCFDQVTLLSAEFTFLLRRHHIIIVRRENRAGVNGALFR